MKENRRAGSHPSSPARPGRLRRRLLLAGLLAPLTLAAAQTPPAVSDAGMLPPPPRPFVPQQLAYQPGPTRVAALPAGFDARLYEAMAQQIVAGERVPGMAMAIVHNGRIVSERGYGITDVNAPQAVNAHTVFRLASLSKAFAGTMTGMLISEGALRWDSRIIDYMPSLRFSDPMAAQQLTVAEVLSQRSGLPHNTYDRDIEANANYRDVVQRLAYVPMSCAPGACYGYQNVAFSLIGDVVFAATGQFYGEAVSRRIFKPLGMNDASVGLEGIEGSPSWARPHVHGRGGWVPVMPKQSYYNVAPAAGVNASISDMAQWLVAQMGHRPDVLPDSLLATLHTPVVSTPTELRGSSWRGQRLDAAGYALGWRVYDYAGHRVVFHGGAVQGYRAAIAMLPDRDLGVVILWNGESSLPSGLIPTVLDGAIGMPYTAWIDLPESTMDSVRYASRPAPASGAEASTANAAPR